MEKTEPSSGRVHRLNGFEEWLRNYVLEIIDNSGITKLGSKKNETPSIFHISHTECIKKKDFFFNFDKQLILDGYPLSYTFFIRCERNDAINCKIVK